MSVFLDQFKTVRGSSVRGSNEVNTTDVQPEFRIGVVQVMSLLF
jgi:hypothetical protein